MSERCRFCQMNHGSISDAHMCAVETADRLASINRELVEALEKAADTFRDTKVVCEMIGRMTLAEGMRIAEEGTRAVLAKVKS